MNSEQQVEFDPSEFDFDVEEIEEKHRPVDPSLRIFYNSNNRRQVYVNGLNFTHKCEDLRIEPDKDGCRVVITLKVKDLAVVGGDLFKTARTER